MNYVDSFRIRIKSTFWSPPPLFGVSINEKKIIQCTTWRYHVPHLTFVIWPFSWSSHRSAFTFNYGTLADYRTHMTIGNGQNGSTMIMIIRQSAHSPATKCEWSCTIHRSRIPCTASDSANVYGRCAVFEAKIELFRGLPQVSATFGKWFHSSSKPFFKER